MYKLIIDFLFLRKLMILQQQLLYQSKKKKVLHNVHDKKTSLNASRKYYCVNIKKYR